MLLFVLGAYQLLCAIELVRMFLSSKCVYVFYVVNFNLAPIINIDLALYLRS